MDPQQEKDMVIWREKKQAEIIDELRNNETMQKFLQRTYPFARERFITEYAHEKVRWLEWGTKYVEWDEAENLKWVNDATKRLMEIQQKKLFDQQCLWRAEKIKIKEIKHCYDFIYWEDNVFNCPFIEPVNESDVEMYLQYIRCGYFEMWQGFLARWQDYDHILAAYNDEETIRTFPNWYEFHNNLTGNSSYLILPSIRGEKEKKYLILAAQERHMMQKAESAVKQMVESALPSTQPKTKPSLDYHKRGWMTWFVNNFDDKETQEAFRQFGGEIVWENMADDDDDGDDLYEVFQLLSAADKQVPIEEHYDWKYAVRKAAYMYQCEKIAEAIPIAYQQYRVHIDMNLAFEEKESIFDSMGFYEEAILRGRELNGEPRDFNF
jgi:hypothetical protein